MRLRKAHLMVGASLTVSAVLAALSSYAAPGAPARDDRYKADSERSDGLIKTEFSTPQGDKIAVFLPSVGTKLSGTVLVVPAGKTEEQRAERMEELSKLSVNLCGEVVPAARKKSFDWKVPLALGSFFWMALQDGDGRKVCETPVSFPQVPTGAISDIQIPRFGVEGQPVVIPGPFDGNLGNTSYKVDGQQVEGLAESEAMFVGLPGGGDPGPAEIEVSDGGKTAKGKHNKFRLEMTTDAGRTMTPGTRAKVNLKVIGWNGVEDGEEVSLRVQNNSPNTVDLEEVGSDVYWRVLTKKDVKGDVFADSLTMTALTPGIWELDALLCVRSTTHYNELSKRVEHSWEVSSLPYHEIKESDKYPHKDKWSNLRGQEHSPEDSSKPIHEPAISDREVSRHYPEHNQRTSIRGPHHNEDSSNKENHSRAVSGRKVHAPALSRSNQPPHDVVVSKRPRHEQARSKSTG